MIKTLLLLMIFCIQECYKISHILKKYYMNIRMIIYVLKKEIKLIISLFLEEKMNILKQELLNFTESVINELR